MIVIEGEVIHGQQLGRRIGFPTANMEICNVDVENGVYMSRVIIDGNQYRGMSNVGVRPSVDGKRRLLETFIFGFGGDIYGRRIRVELLCKVRDEKKFESIGALKSQLERDSEQIRSL